MNTQLIAHRVNTISELNQLPVEYGIEIDIRDSKKGLILSHDPFNEGELFQEFLCNYRHKTIILNIKSERIEYEVLKLLDDFKVTNYFFLDCSFPMIIELSNSGINNIAARISEYETVDSIRKIIERISWIWLDSFHSFHFNSEIIKEISQLKLKTCLVSPELQKREEEINLYIKKMKNLNFKVDAICTKSRNFQKWQNFLDC